MHVGQLSGSEPDRACPEGDGGAAAALPLGTGLPLARHKRCPGRPVSAFLWGAESAPEGRRAATRPKNSVAVYSGLSVELTSNELKSPARAAVSRPPGPGNSRAGRGDAPVATARRGKRGLAGFSGFWRRSTARAVTPRRPGQGGRFRAASCERAVVFNSKKLTNRVFELIQTLSREFLN